VFCGMPPVPCSIVQQAMPSACGAVCDVDVVKPQNSILGVLVIPLVGSTQPMRGGGTMQTWRTPSSTSWS
jgi:hypothetical protein